MTSWRALYIQSTLTTPADFHIAFVKIGFGDGNIEFGRQFPVDGTARAR